jgi:hypothetical protein
VNLVAVGLARLGGELPPLARGLALEPGSELVARVVAAGDGGRGTIALAGAVVPARLPHGVEAGQTLRLQVVRVESGELTVRIQADDAGRPAAAQELAQAAGGLAVSGDGELLRAALAMTGQQAMWLPDGGAAAVVIDPDAGTAGGAPGGAGVAAFVLHSPALGPIEVRISMAPGGVRAGVVTAPGAASALAEAARDELAGRLSSATGRPAAVSVTPRPAGVAAPQPPSRRVDVQA